MLMNKWLAQDKAQVMIASVLEAKQGEHWSIPRLENAIRECQMTLAHRKACSQASIHLY